MLSNLPDRDADYTKGYRDPGAPLTVGVQTLADGTCLVSVWGEVDFSTAPHLERVLDEASRAGDQEVLVEFSRDSFIDSRPTRSHPGRPTLERARSLFRVTTENPHTRRVIETMGLTAKLGLQDSSAGEAPA